MARRGRWSRFRQRTRVIVQRVRSRSRRPTSFVKKNKTMLIVLALGVGAYIFRDKIKELVAKKA